MANTLFEGGFMFRTMPLTRRIWFAWLAIVSLALPIDVAAGAPAPSFVFEDRNNNGVFDASDVDVTGVLLSQGIFHTNESVVITGGPLKMPDPRFKQAGGAVGISIRAGKNIVIESNILCSSAAGSVDVAGDTVTIASNVTIDGRYYVSVHATNDIEIGDTVKVTSKGGGAYVGSATVSSTAGSIDAGSKFQMSTLGDAILSAGGGSISLGSGSILSSSRGGVSLRAATDIFADETQTSAPSSLSLGAGLGADDMVSLRSSRLSVRTSAANGGSISVSASNGTIDVRGTKFAPVTPQLTAARIITVDPPVTPPPPPPGTEYLGATILPRALGEHLEAEERVLLDLLNEIRVANGKPPFWAVSARLTQAADWHSRDMFRTGNVSHTSSNGWYIGDRLSWFGWNNILFSQPAGEIIYEGSGNTSIANAAAAVQWWMNSTPHRQQILTASYAHIGIGRASNADGTTAFWTVDFSGQSAYGTSIDGGVIRAWDLGYLDPATP